MLKKILKIILLTILIAGITVLSILLIFKIIFNQQKLKKMFIDGTRGFASREAALDGININPFNGIKIDGLSVSEKQSFSAGTFLELKNFTFQFKILPLLHYEFIISRIEFNELSAKIVRKNDLSFNISDLIFSQQHKKYLSPLALMVSDLSINHSKLIYTDLILNKNILFKDITINSKNISLFSSFDSDISFNIVYLTDIFNCNGNITAELGNSKIIINNFCITDKATGLKVFIAGSISDINKLTPVLFDINIKGSRKVIEKICAVIPGITNLQFSELNEINFSIQGEKNNFKIQFRN